MPPKKRPNKLQSESKTDEKIVPATQETETATRPLNVVLTAEARTSYLALRTSDPTRFEKVTNALQKIAENPRHPGLNSHEFRSKKGPNNSKLWESYVENRTPAAYRIFWYYGPDPATITVVAIIPHP